MSASRALRNMVVRNPDLKDTVLAEGAERYLNMAMRSHEIAHDDAKAALRDLGCKIELKERWKGKPRTTLEEIEGGGTTHKGGSMGGD
eukprot:UC1_evm1s1371